MPYLKKCIDSVLSQTYADIEVVLVDDGSTDGCGLVCDEYAKIDSRIKVIHKENGGLVSAWKLGLKESSGDYIGFIDSDDFCDNDYFEKLMCAVKVSEADLAICGFIMDYDEKSKNIQERASGYIKAGEYSDDALNYIKSNYFSLAHTFFWARWIRVTRRSLILDNINYAVEKIRVGEDVGIALSTLFDAKKIAVIDNFGYHYVQRNNSLMHSFSDAEIENFDSLCDNIDLICREKGYTNNYHREFSTQLAILLNRLLKSNLKTSMKLEKLRQIRYCKNAVIALQKQDNFNNLSKKRKVILILFKRRLYRTILMLSKLR